jgi:hypothetical protein
LLVKNKYKAITNIDDEVLCAFGLDIVINDGAHNRSDNCSYLGYSYELPEEGWRYGTKKAYSYLARSHEFKVRELEVFEVILKH